MVLGGQTFNVGPEKVEVINSAISQVNVTISQPNITVSAVIVCDD